MIANQILTIERSRRFYPKVSEQRTPSSSAADDDEKDRNDEPTRAHKDAEVRIDGSERWPRSITDAANIELDE